MDLKQADWISRRLPELGRRHHLRRPDWPEECWVAFQRSPDSSWTWEVWLRHPDGHMEQTAVSLSGPGQLVSAVNRAADRLDGDQKRDPLPIDVERLAVLMAFDMLDGRLLSGKRLFVAKKVQQTTMPSDQPDPMVTAMMTWSKAREGCAGFLKSEIESEAPKP